MKTPCSDRLRRCVPFTVATAMAFALALCGSGCRSGNQPPPPPTALTHPPTAPPSAPETPGNGAQRPTVAEILKQAAARPPATVEGDGWRSLFDGHTLTGWGETPFAARGQVEVRDGLIYLAMGEPFTGIQWTNPPPSGDYELALEAMRVNGWDFFCGLTFPVRDTFCSLIVGGWGGGLVGLSSIDGYDASENETTKMLSFEPGQWYRVRLRVAHERIQVWLDDKQVIDLVTKERRVGLRPGDIELSKPLGVASWSTGAAVRNIQVRNVP